MRTFFRKMSDIPEPFRKEAKLGLSGNYELDLALNSKLAEVTRDHNELRTAVSLQALQVPGLKAGAEAHLARDFVAELGRAPNSAELQNMAELARIKAPHLFAGDADTKPAPRTVPPRKPQARSRAELMQQLAAANGEPSPLRKAS